MAFLLMLLSSAGFITMSALIKTLGTEIPLIQMVFLRALLAVPFLFCWVAVLASINYVSVVLSVIYGYIFWEQRPQTMTFVGGIFIVAGGLLLIISRWRITGSARLD